MSTTWIFVEPGNRDDSVNRCDFYAPMSKANFCGGGEGGVLSHRLSLSRTLIRRKEVFVQKRWRMNSINKIEIVKSNKSCGVACSLRFGADSRGFAV